MAPTPPNPQPQVRKQAPKLPRLPPNTKITKRPLPRAPIPSKYTSSSTPKLIYISTKTPFLSAIKRTEKLLHHSEKRLIQSATDHAKRSTSHRRARGGDDILSIANEVEKSKKREEVVIKGAGKAIAKVMEVGVWFQERGDVYKVRLETGSVGTVDDIEVDEEEQEKEEVPETRVRYLSVLEVFVSLR